MCLLKWAQLLRVHMILEIHICSVAKRNRIVLVLNHGTQVCVKEGHTVTYFH
jgi:hypothetical protein